MIFDIYVEKKQWTEQLKPSKWMQLKLLHAHKKNVHNRRKYSIVIFISDEYVEVMGYFLPLADFLEN